MAILSSCGADSLLRFLLLSLFLYLTSCSDIPVSPFAVRDLDHTHLVTRRDIEYSPKIHADVRVLDPELYSDRLDISLVESATSWLEIRWHLRNGTGASVGVPKLTRVRCHYRNTTTFYHVFNKTTRYRIPYLLSNTRYMVCVEMVITSMANDLLHFRCVHFSTIPLVRSDSILGLILTLGYILGMGMIGYVTWWMRMRKHAASQKNENELELSCRTSTIRFSEIEERAHFLNSNQSQTSVKS